MLPFFLFLQVKDRTRMDHMQIEGQSVTMRRELNMFFPILLVLIAGLLGVAALLASPTAFNINCPFFVVAVHIHSWDLNGSAMMFFPPGGNYTGIPHFTFSPGVGFYKTACHLCASELAKELAKKLT